MSTAHSMLVIVLLAVGIAAGTITYSVVDAVVLRPSVPTTTSPDPSGRPGQTHADAREALSHTSADAASLDCQGDGLPLRPDPLRDRSRRQRVVGLELAAVARAFGPRRLVGDQRSRRRGARARTSRGGRHLQGSARRRPSFGATA